ncbi:transcription elongation factor GreA [Gordonia sp. CPCC 206044]|uniref:transcription elongation factor GreA n=1 Tax=Gordonia sp. CPCC 206044 TaxID=3140793 RepID=UPI003AF3F34C
MTDTQVTWLTQESHDRLKGELDSLIANRPVIAAEINERREEGDLKENGGYHAAREEQGQQEARIRQLQELLNNAKVGEAPTQSGVALPGSVVTVYYDGDEADKETFLIATREESASSIETYSPSSPLGAALIDAKVGETREYSVPSGAVIKVTLVSAEPYHG